MEAVKVDKLSKEQIIFNTMISKAIMSLIQTELYTKNLKDAKVKCIQVQQIINRCKEICYYQKEKNEKNCN